MPLLLFFTNKTRSGLGHVGEEHQHGGRTCHRFSDLSVTQAKSVTMHDHLDSGQINAIGGQPK